MSQINLISNIYNPANQTEQEVIESFIVRIKEFEKLFNEIKKSSMKFPEQHFIIQGPRGSGKTTLLLRLSAEIKNDDKLNKWLIPIRFNEEQYNIRTLNRLWEETALRLEHYECFFGLYDEMQNFRHEEDYEIKSYQLLSKSLRSNGKKIVLMIDNFGDMLKKFQDREHQRLREVLITSSDIRIIGTSSVMLESTYDYSKPFYEFFDVIQLEGLDREETISFLLKLSERYKQEEVENIVKNNPGRVEALRRLTGGVPRTIVLLFEIFADSNNGNSFKDLESVLDRVTPLYKHRMDDMSAQMQEIIDVIAMNWDAISTKEIAQKTRMDSKAVSSYLSLLEKNKIIIKIATNTKNHLYQINERFFNIWYLMRYGGEKERNKVLWLAQFLESWCDKEELVSRAKNHIKALEDGQLYGRYAVYMTEALARTGISEDLQDYLIKSTREFIGKSDKGLLRELSKSDKELFEEACNDYDNGNYKSSLNKFMSIVNKNGSIYFNIALLHERLNSNDNKKEEYYLKAIDNKIVYAMFNIANLYFKAEKYDDAKKYYLMAIEHNDLRSMFNLAFIYNKEQKYDEAEKYYLVAINSGDDQAMLNLANMYCVEQKFEKAEKYYLMAVNHGNSKAMNNLAYLYKEQKEFQRAEKYYLMAIEKNELKAIRNLGDLYKDDYNDLEKAEKYYLMGVEQGCEVAMNELAWLYFKQKRNGNDALSLAERSYNIEKNIYSSHTYSILLLWNNQVEAVPDVSKVFLEDAKSFEEFNDNIILFFMLLIAKKQFNLALEILRGNKFNLIDKYKPIYYALMYFIQDDYPNEYKKMGEELKTTVTEIVAEIGNMAIEYA